MKLAEGNKLQEDDSEVKEQLNNFFKEAVLIIDINENSYSSGNWKLGLFFKPKGKVKKIIPEKISYFFRKNCTLRNFHILEWSPI